MPFDGTFDPPVHVGWMAALGAELPALQAPRSGECCPSLSGVHGDL
jgi:hypothetical protein